MLVVALDHRELLGEALKPVDGLSVADVAGADDLLDLVGHEEVFEVRRDVYRTHRDVQVADHKCELRSEPSRKALLRRILLPCSDSSCIFIKSLIYLG